MANFKYKLKETEIGDTKVFSGNKSTVTNIDPETGGITWDITTVPEIYSTFNMFAQLKRYIKKLSVDKQDDFKFQEIAQKVEKIFNDFRTHIRNNYPEEYKTLNKVNEESTIASDSGFTSGGEGENYMPAFRKAQGQANKNAKAYFQAGYKKVNEFKYRLSKKPLKEADTNVESYLSGLNIQNPNNKKFIASRLLGFDELETKLNQLIPLIQQAKHETMDYYRQKPESFNIVYGTDLANDYLNDLIELFKK